MVFEELSRMSSIIIVDADEDGKSIYSETPVRLLNDFGSKDKGSSSKQKFVT